MHVVGREEWYSRERSTQETASVRRHFCVWEMKRGYLSHNCMGMVFVNIKVPFLNCGRNNRCKRGPHCPGNWCLQRQMEICGGGSVVQTQVPSKAKRGAANSCIDEERRKDDTLQSIVCYKNDQLWGIVGSLRSMMNLQEPRSEEP